MINRTSLTLLFATIQAQHTFAQQVTFDRINPPGEDRVFASYISSVVTSPSTNPPPPGLANSVSDPADTGALNPGSISITDWLVDENQVTVSSAYAKSHAKMAHAKLDGLSSSFADTESFYHATSWWLGRSQTADARTETSARFHDSWKRNPGSPQGAEDVFNMWDVKASVEPNWVGNRVYGDVSRIDVSAPGLMGIVWCRCLPIALDDGGTAHTFVHVRVRWIERQPDGSFIPRSVDETRRGETTYNRWWMGAVQGTQPDDEFHCHGWAQSIAKTYDVGVTAHPQNNPHHKDATLKAKCTFLGLQSTWPGPLAPP